MGKIKEIAQNSKNPEFRTDPLNVNARLAGEFAGGLKSVTDGQNLTTSTKADKGEKDETGSNDHNDQEIFARAEQVRQEKFNKQEKVKDEQQIRDELLEEKSSEKKLYEEKAPETNLYEEKAFKDKSNYKNDNRTEKVKNIGQESRFHEQSEKEETRLSDENRRNEELQQDIDRTEYKKIVRERVVTDEREQQEKQQDEDDRFNKRDRSLKESSEVKTEIENSRLNSRDDKFNQENSLQKIRGGEKVVAEEGVKEGAKKSALASSGSKISSGLLVAQVIKTAASSFSVDYSKKRGNEATESTGVIIFVIAAIVILLLSPILLIMIPIMGGAGGRRAYDQMSSQSYGSATAEEIILWNALMEHFEDNETAVLGIMCNAYYESGFLPNNLENTNNTVWGISDEEYTDAVNDGTLTREQFSKDMWGDSCRGYDSRYGWVNPDGGYGYCQFTSFDKKDGLYQYALDYFDYGIGEGQDFDISDATMQANYICYLLDGEYSDLDEQLRAATTIADATYVWTAGYEKPRGNWEDIAEYRAGIASTIKSECEGGVVGGGGTGSTVSEEELSATHIHYNQYDTRWGSLPYYYSSGGSNTISASGCGPTSLAMVVTELTRNSSNPIVLTPDAACDYSANHGCHVSGGTSHALFQSPLTDTYGISGVEISTDETTMKSYLDDGCLLIITVGPGTYTTSGHCMTIDEYDDTGFLINDPNYGTSKPYRVSHSYLISTSEGHLEHAFALWLNE